MNKVKLVVDKNNLTAKFECEGDVWKWLNKVKNRNSHDAFEILNKIRYNETESFFYETQLNKFIRRYRDADIEVVEGEILEGRMHFQIHCEA